MSRHALQIIAGARAKAHIERHGVHQEDFRVMVGASGGPKWLALAKLDEYLFGEFFAGRRTPLDLLGSSAGAWRFACFAQHDPVAASRRFRDAYHHIRFPEGSTIDDVTRISRTLLDTVFPDGSTPGQILGNDIIRLNFIVNRARPLAAGRAPLTQAAGMGMAALANLISRKAIGAFFERIIFHTPLGRPPFYDLDDLPTERIPLNENNLRNALMASGSIPMALHPVENIPGAGPGRYYDGGVTDYHFDIPFCDRGLVLYPHFYSHITPGWFDKMVKWRRANPEHYDNVVLACPTPEWLASLPGGRIPDRKDFGRLPDNEREAAWAVAIEKSSQLADDFRRFAAGDLSFMA